LLAQVELMYDFICICVWSLHELMRYHYINWRMMRGVQ